MGRPPVLVLGSHRSGTSLVARVLADLGLFIGRKREENDEALFFLRLNEWLLDQAGAAWDRPAPFLEAAADPSRAGLLADGLRSLLGSPRLAGYLGLGRWIRNRSVFRIDRPWGFKDPRTLITLPVWRKLWPEARIVCVHRNGVDVAQSLRARAERQVANARARLDAGGFRGRERFSGPPRWPRVADSLRCLSLEESFRLWEEYTDAAELHLRGLRYVAVRYEDFVLAPAEHLGRMAEEAGLSPRREQIDAAAGRVRPGRGNAYLEDPRLRAFHETVRASPAMRRHGYDAGCGAGRSSAGP